MRASISVAMCTYNGSRYIAHQVRSILAQTVLPDQLVISDDGSNDDTMARVRAALLDAPSSIRVTLIQNPSQLGVTANFARAIESCDGELVALCDQDDVWHPDRLASAVATFADPEVLLVHSDATLVNDEGEVLGATLLKSLGIRSRERKAISSGRAFEAYLRRNLVTGATAMFRRSIYDTARPLPTKWVHDEWIALVAAATGKVVLLDDALIDYRQHASNQIGVAAPTVSYRIGRMLAPRGLRYVELAERAEILAERLRLGSASTLYVEMAERKRDFERTRAAYPRNRLARIPRVLANAARGDYANFSSQGVLDIARDLLQPE